MNFRHLTKTTIKLLILQVLLCKNVNAGVIINNSYNELDNDGANFSNSLLYSLWDDFELSDDYGISSGTFWFKGTPRSNFQFNIANNDNGKIGENILSKSLLPEDVFTTVLNDGWRRYDFKIKKFHIESGSYWISFSSNGLYGSSLNGNGLIQKFNTGTYSTGSPYGMNFTISGIKKIPTSISEPPTSGIFIFSIIIFIFRNKMAKQ